jgi:hypothetical protein
MTFDDVCAVAHQWPEVEDSTSYGTPALKVRNKLLTRLKEDGESLVLIGIEPDERDMLIEAHPKIFYFTEHYRNYPMMLARLPRCSRKLITPFLLRRWRALASKSALEALDGQSRR